MNAQGMARRKASDASWIHSAALVLGHSSLLATNGTLIIGDLANSSGVCYAQGVPPGTSQATAAFLSDQVAVRHLLENDGIPVPRWKAARFTGSPEATRVAKKLGYPLNVRAGWGGRQATSSLLSIAVDPGKLDDAVSQLREAAGPRAMRPTQPRARMMLERRVADQVLRLLIINGDTVAAAYEASYAAPDPRPTHVAVSDVHPQARDLARHAAHAIPDLPIATVRLQLEDAGRDLDSQRHAVIGVDMYAGIEVYEGARHGSAQGLAMRIVAGQIQEDETDTPAEWGDVSASIRVYGLPDADRSKEAISTFVSRRRRLECSDISVSHDHVEFALTGDPIQVASACESLVDGRADKQHPLYLEINAL